MVREDRRLRLAGYEVYRFGAVELMADDGSAVAIHSSRRCSTDMASANRRPLSTDEGCVGRTAE